MNIHDWFSFNRIRVELMKIAHARDDDLLNRLDPRVLLVWYVVFTALPWAFFDNVVLGAMFLFTSVLVAVSRVNRVLLVILAFGMVSNLAFVAGFVWLVGGDPLGTVGALIPYNLKMAVISLTSIAVFTTMNPSRLSRALLSFRIPRRFTFVIAYGYRMLFVLLEEYRDIVHSLRLRSKAPESPGWMGWRHLLYLLKIGVRAFYPLIFDVAKRSRVTVEAMETRGFSHSLSDPDSRRLRLDDLKTTSTDAWFLAVSVLFVAFLFWLRSMTFLAGWR